MKNIIQNVLTIAMLPVIAAGVMWAAIREAWEMGSECSGILADWFNRK